MFAARSILRRGWPLVVGICTCGAILSVALSGAAAAAKGGQIGFETPAVADPIHTWGEPTIGVDPQGRVFVSGPTGTGTQRSAWEGSVDAGHSFRVITPGPVPTAIQSTEDPPGGGDTDLNFDRSGKQYFADLYALTCLRAATTSDGGASVQQNFLGCDGSPGADRQWLAVYDPPTGTPHQSAYTGPTPLVYLEYNNLLGPGPNGGGQWNKSTDGLTYTNATSGVTPATEATYSPFGPDGYPAIDQQTGKVFQAAGFPSGDGSYDLELNIGTPDAAGNLTFLDAPTASSNGGPNYEGLIHIADNLPGSPDTLFTVASVDSARNLYVAWALDTGAPSGRQVYISASSATSGWRTWTKPVQVSDGSTGTGDAVNVFPWIKAGGPGRADAVWYGSNMNVDPSSQSGQAWNVFMNQVVFPVDKSGAITGQAPSTTLVKVSPHPMHYNDICLQGTGCINSQGNRNLADFFTVTIDKSGAAEIVYDDTSNGLAQPGFTPTGNQTVDHAGAAVVTIARQSSGPGLYGTTVQLPLFLQTLMNYPAMQSGLALSPRGVGAMCAAIVVGRLIGFIDSRVLIAAGFVLFGFSALMYSQMTLAISLWSVASVSLVNGISTGLIFVPLSTTTLGRLRNEQMGNATGIYNLMRNIGGSVGISLVTTLLARAAQVHQNVLVQHLTPYDPMYVRKLGALRAGLARQTDPVTASRQALGVVYNVLVQQATLLAFADNFRLLSFLGLACAPLAALFARVMARRVGGAH